MKSIVRNSKPTRKRSWNVRSILSIVTFWCFVASTKSQSTASINHHIINGKPVGSSTSKSTSSFFARPAWDELKWTSDSICGATLIHDDILITAAHCQGAFHYGLYFYDSILNSFSNQKVMIDRQIRHPQWDYYGINEGAVNYDILLMRLEAPIESIDTSIK